MDNDKQIDMLKTLLENGSIRKEGIGEVIELIIQFAQSDVDPQPVEKANVDVYTKNRLEDCIVNMLQAYYDTNVSKILVIKCLRLMTGWGLKESKEWVDSNLIDKNKD
jgi:ribosomal protein L7/L12